MERRFRAVVIHGPYPLVRGFVTGVLAGKGETGRVFYCERDNIEADLDAEEGLAEKLAEWIGLQKYLVTTVVIEEKVHGPIVEALKRAREELRLSVEASRAVKEASLEARFRTFSQSEGIEIRRLVENPPGGVKTLPDFTLRESRREEAAGIEAYAPEHDYELEGSFACVGPVDRIVEYRKRLVENPLVQCRPVRLALE
ncbi:MAG: hypothetical protein ABIH26_13695 [Candidatus Eisenbacteria bacterium]